MKKQSCAKVKHIEVSPMKCISEIDKTLVDNPCSLFMNLNIEL